MSARTAAPAASKAHAPQAGPRHGVYLHHGAPVTVAEREAAADGAAAGWKARQREAAADVIRTAEHVPGASYVMPPDFWPLDRETGERVPADARAILAEAEAAAAERVKALPEARAILARLRAVRSERPLTAKERKAHAAALDLVTARVSVGRFTLASQHHMTQRDVVSLARYARACAERMARPRLSEAEAQDVESDAALAILARAVSPGAMPRWDALAGVAQDTDALAESGITADDRRGAWKGFAYLEARAAIRRRHERLSTEQAADFTAPGEDDAPTPEQAAAMAAEAASAALLDALDTGSTQHGVYALSATAEAPLSAPERDALSMALSGLTRKEIAEARAVSTEAVKKAAQRGRKALDQRGTTEQDATRWAACAGRRLRNLSRPDDRTPAQRAMAQAVATYRGVRLAWPDREAPCDGGDTGHVPAPITGAGEHGRTPALSAGDGHAQGKAHGPHHGPRTAPRVPVLRAWPPRPEQAPRPRYTEAHGEKAQAQAAQAARAAALALALADGRVPFTAARIAQAAAQAAAASVARERRAAEAAARLRAARR
jgi:DNA-binding CsgD family transcriptional regulator